MKSLSEKEFGDPNSRAEYKIELDKQLISTQDVEQYNALALIKKRALGGWFAGIFGHVYFLEKRNTAGKKLFGLFGGEIEHTDPTKPEPDKDRTSAAALARELNEEIGGFGKNASNKFKPGDFIEFASIVRNSESRKKSAIDIYKLEDDTAKRLSEKQIKAHKKNLINEVSGLQERLAGSLSIAEKENIEERIRRIQTDASFPMIKVRRVGSLWIKLHFSWRPGFIRITPNWTKFTPTATYALINDGLIQDHINDY